MTKRYRPHTSSLFNMQANIVVTIAWLAPLLLGVLFNSDSLSMLFQVFLLLFEKKSDFVRKHVGQAIALSFTLYALNWCIAFVGGMMVAQSGVDVMQGTFIGAAFAGVGILSLLIIVILFVGIVVTIMGVIKALNWEDFSIPIIHPIGKWFTETFKL